MRLITSIITISKDFILTFSKKRTPLSLTPWLLGKPTIAFNPLINVERMGAIHFNASINQKLQANDTATLFYQRYPVEVNVKSDYKVSHSLLMVYIYIFRVCDILD